MCLEVLLYAYESCLEDVEDKLHAKSWQDLPSACQGLEEVAMLIKQIPLSDMPSQDMRDKLWGLSMKQRRLMRHLSAQMDGVKGDLKGVNHSLSHVEYMTNQFA